MSVCLCVCMRVRVYCASPLPCVRVFHVAGISSSNKRSSPPKEKERMPGPDEVYTTSVFGAGGVADQGASGQSAPLVVGERPGYLDSYTRYRSCAWEPWRPVW